MRREPSLFPIFGALMSLSAAAVGQANPPAANPLASNPETPETAVANPGAAKPKSQSAAAQASAGSPKSNAFPSNPSAQTGSKPTWREIWRKQWLAEQERKARAVAAKPSAAQAKAPAKSASPSGTTVAPPSPRPALPGETSKSSAAMPSKPVTAAKPAAGKPIASGAAVRQKPVSPKATGSAYSLTKADIGSVKTSSASRTDRTQDSPFAAIRDSGKMLLYLAPMLLLIVGGLRLMRRFLDRSGRLPRLSERIPGDRKPRGTLTRLPRLNGGLMNTLMGGLALDKARQRGGSNIQVVESVPIGGANLHLVEVKGRTLLLGATAMSVQLLAEFREEEAQEEDTFRRQFQAVAADLDTLDLATVETPVGAVVSSLEDEMQDIRETVENRLRRLRALQELHASGFPPKQG